MSRLIEDLASYRPFRAIVVGDFMLDQSVYGAAERLSPDAPVPVLHADRTENHPGGAANVALCLRELKAEVACLGVVGGDPEGETLREAIAAAGCEVEGLLADPGRPTTIKRSMIGLAQHRHPQKMFRVDLESREPLADAIVEGKAVVSPPDDAKRTTSVSRPGSASAIALFVVPKSRPIPRTKTVTPGSIERRGRRKGRTGGSAERRDRRDRRDRDPNPVGRG